MRFKFPKRQTSGAVVCFSCQKLVEIKSKCSECGQINPGLWGYSRFIRSLGSDFGFIKIVSIGCICLYLVTLLADPGGITNTNASNLLSPSSKSLEVFGSSGAIPLLYGRWWTVISSGWLHGDIWHIGFNLALLNYFSSIVAQNYGAARLVSIYTFTTITSSFLASMVGKLVFLQFLTNFIAPASFSVGASGGVYGLLGALVVCYFITGRQQALEQILLLCLVFFMLSFFSENVSHWGHIGGFLGGILISSTPWFSTKTTQRYYHIGIAGVALLLTLFCIIWAPLDGFFLHPSDYLWFKLNNI